MLGALAAANRWQKDPAGLVHPPNFVSQCSARKQQQVSAFAVRQASHHIAGVALAGPDDCKSRCGGGGAAGGGGFQQEGVVQEQVQ